MSVKNSEDILRKLGDLERKILEGEFKSSSKLQQQKADVEVVEDTLSKLEKRWESEVRDSSSHHSSTSVKIDTALIELRELKYSVTELTRRIELLEKRNDDYDKRIESVQNKILLSIVGAITTWLINYLL